MTAETAAPVPSAELAEFTNLVLRAKRRAFMDSNDMEIERLQAAVSAACRLLGVDENSLAEKAEAWAEGKGYI